MSWLFSQALVAEYSAACCSDGEPSAPSSSTNTPAMYLSHGKTTDVSNLSRYGMTCEPFEASRGEELLMWFLAGFPARTSAQQDTESVSMENGADSGAKWPESLAKYDPDSRSWKTRQLSLFGGLEEFSGTWPSWGMMRGGAFFPLLTLAHNTSVSGSGSLPTVTKFDGSGLTATPNNTLIFWAKCRGSGTNRADGIGSEPLPELRRTMLNPCFCESMMGWPIRWTAFSALETGKFRQWFASHGKPLREGRA
jgi:hypothetical protein